MGLLDRLRQWSEIQKVRPAEESAGVTGGRDGELLVRELVGSSGRFKDAHLLAGRRIPSKRQGRRREIDLIVCTPAMIQLIEVKNWSGRLTIRDGTWLQTRRGGDVVDHGDMIRENGLRRDAVVEYLRDRGLVLDEQVVRDHIAAKVVFTNPNLELAPEVEARPDVVSRRELDGELGPPGRKGLAERMFSSLVEFCLNSVARSGDAAGRIPSDLYEKIVSHLAEVQTWDELGYYGSQVVTGDVVALNIGKEKYRKPQLTEMAGGSPIQLRWTRGRFWGLVKAVTGLGSLGSVTLGKHRLEVSTADTVMFHAVGDVEPRPRRLVDLSRIVLG
ncbi:nuclease-related domain-containing protein [Paludisphaera mucosa]|uniref:Nuclease-related domain-containing protein n=1 Tax=Paludisphaera mucosa TaxID=3030827 RepID=A0ABT6FJJ7_9BACT|nr:nuclease-related domain-containing protein [Paludisphaera mucosa]MDG3007756.1 nuclease-related domain-containing protein [Paludisphaera mucosa]